MEDFTEFAIKRAEKFKSLFDVEWDGKKIWQHIRDLEPSEKNLTATPAFEGKLYKTANTKVMFVGRDLNGWDMRLEDCSTLEKTVESIVNQQGALESLVNEEGYGGEDGRRKYYHKHSKFFRLIKHTLEFLGESDSDIDNTFYHDSQEWNQKIVWANLYCISPRCPISSQVAHSDSKMVKLGNDDYVDLMKIYIDYYKPDAVVFITDINGWFVRWQKKRSFKCILDQNSYHEYFDGDTIVATGKIGRTKVIVCKRPDKWGTSYARVKEMAKNLADYIQKSKEK